MHWDNFSWHVRRQIGMYCRWWDYSEFEIHFWVRDGSRFVYAGYSQASVLLQSMFSIIHERGPRHKASYIV